VSLPNEPQFEYCAARLYIRLHLVEYRRLDIDYDATDITTLLYVWAYTADNICGIDSDDPKFAMLEFMAMPSGDWLHSPQFLMLVMTAS
jgi:hypothetical protein